MLVPSSALVNDDDRIACKHVRECKLVGILGRGADGDGFGQGSPAWQDRGTVDFVFLRAIPGTTTELKEAFPECVLADDPIELFSRCQRIVLAVKPQILKEIASQLRSLVRGNHLLISIAAGISLPQLAEWLGTQRVIRVMPNTPAQVTAGASGMSSGKDCTADDRTWALQLMNSVGIVVEVSDPQLHAVTGLSGSGPAYVLLMIEALSDGGVAAGLARDVATKLAVQTVLGTAKMVAETGLHPAVLREQVTSPGGTTIAALQTLEQRGMRSALIDAVKAAADRSRELSC